jgi:hypothetical protein
MDKILRHLYKDDNDECEIIIEENTKSVFVCLKTPTTKLKIERQKEIMENLLKDIGKYEKMCIGVSHLLRDLGIVEGITVKCFTQSET